MEFSRQDTKVFKGLAICMMLYHHLFAYPHKIASDITYISLYTFGETTLSTYIGQFARVGLMVFVFFSGFGCYIASQRSQDQQSFVLQRVFGMYKSFWKVFLIVIPISVFGFGLMPSPPLRELIYNFLALKDSLNAEWWFIVPYTILLVIFPLIQRFLDRKNALVTLDLAYLIFFNAFLVYILPEICKWEIFVPFCDSLFWNHIRVALSLFPAFVMGCIFAKYHLLDLVKTRFAGKLPWCVLSLLVLVLLFYIHLYNYSYYDFINAPIFIACITILLPTLPGKLISRVLTVIGQESTYIWLTHSFFCYYWIQNIVYAPRYSFLIFLWLLCISFASAKVIRLFWHYAQLLYDRLFPVSQAVGKS